MLWLESLNDSGLLPFVVPIQALYGSRQNLSQQDGFDIKPLIFKYQNVTLGLAITLYVGGLDEISRAAFLSLELQHLEMILTVMAILQSVRVYFTQIFQCALQFINLCNTSRR